MSSKDLFEHLIPKQPQEEVAKARAQLRKMVLTKSAEDFKEKLGKANALNIFLSSQLRKANIKIAQQNELIKEMQSIQEQMSQPDQLEQTMFEAEEDELWPSDL